MGRSWPVPPCVAEAEEGDAASHGSSESPLVSAVDLSASAVGSATLVVLLVVRRDNASFFVDDPCDDHQFRRTQWVTFAHKVGMEADGSVPISDMRHNRHTL